jgi:hypothetical protein
MSNCFVASTPPLLTHCVSMYWRKSERTTWDSTVVTCTGTTCLIALLYTFDAPASSLLPQIGIAGRTSMFRRAGAFETRAVTPTDAAASLHAHFVVGTPWSASTEGLCTSNSGVGLAVSLELSKNRKFSKPPSKIHCNHDYVEHVAIVCSEKCTLCREMHVQKARSPRPGGFDSSQK